MGEFNRLAEIAPALRELILDGTGLGSDEFALRAIGKSLPCSLHLLGLSTTKLRVPQLQQLQEVMPPLLELRTLVLASAQMDDACAKELTTLLEKGQMTALQVLDIRGNAVSQETAVALRDNLLKMPAFKEL